MLTGKLVRPRLRPHGSEITVDLIGERHPRWLRTAADLIDLLQKMVGQPRAVWERALERYEGNRTDYIVIRGLAKVLADAATFEPLETPLPPIEARRTFFAAGPVLPRSTLFHQQTRAEVMQRLAQERGMTDKQAQESLYADLPPTYIMRDAGPPWEPEQLLARYNLELSRGALYYASEVRIRVYDHFKDLLKFTKFYKLMYWARPLEGGGYEIEIYGPISQFLTSSRRYGRQYAKWLPALLLCDRWQMTATLRLPKKQEGDEEDLGEEPEPEEEEELTWAPDQDVYSYRLDSTSQLPSIFKRAGEFDSNLEQVFAEEFGDFAQKFGAERGHWQLVREPELLLLQDTVMIPDFAVQHIQDPQRKILIELVGFWKPDYLKRKLRKLQEARCAEMLVLVYEGLGVSKEDFKGVKSQVLFFRSKPIIKEILPVIEDMAERLYGPLSAQERRRKAEPPLPLEQLLRSYDEQVAQAGEREWFLLAQLEDILKRLDPTFSPRRYGFTTLSALVQGNTTLFATRRRRGAGRPLEVCLLCETMTHTGGEV